MFRKIRYKFNNIEKVLYIMEELYIMEKMLKHFIKLQDIHVVMNKDTLLLTKNFMHSLRVLI